MSLWNATPAQIRTCIFDLTEFSDDIVAKVADTDEVVDALSNYGDDWEDCEQDHNYVGGDKYPDPLDSIGSLRDDDGEFFVDDLAFDGDALEFADQAYKAARETQKFKTPADFR
jgi:hypothetical protein